MNPDTRVAVCCYAGDAHQVITMLDLYMHHECPVTVFSPEDSRADIRYPGVDNLFGGKRAYVGQDCLDRMRIHLAMLLDYPEEHFLIHDSDSICLSPELPAALYAEPDMLWSNQVSNDIPEQQPGFPPDIPHIAFQPPWFLSRKTIGAILASGAPVVNPILPFIDYWLVEAAVRSGIPWCSLPNTVSADLSRDTPTTVETSARVMNAVRNEGLIFLHSIKGAEFAAPYIQARAQYVYNKAKQ